MSTKVKFINKKLSKKINKILNKKSINILLIFLFIIASFLSGILFDKLAFIKTPKQASDINVTQNNKQTADLIALQDKVFKKNYVFNIKWGNLGKKMIEDGVIDKTKLAQAITGTDKLPKDLDKYLSEEQNKIEVNQQNAQFWVDVLWGLGLANRNAVLEKGQMVEGNQTANFASTGGYTIGVNQPMDIYSKYSYIELSAKQQETVEEIANNIYRPCCGNSTAFPDCNHGMAMLGLIELMVSQNFSKDDIYKTALAFNTYWFPDTYLNIAYYFDKNGQDYSKISAKELLSQTYSSATGYAAIAKEAEGLQWPALQNSGGSCGA